MASWQGVFCQLPQYFFMFADRQIGVISPNPREHSLHIAIHDGNTLRKTKRSHCGGCRATNARQCDQLCRRSWKLSAKTRHHILRTLVQIASTAVITQTTPQPHHLVLGCCRQVKHGGKVLQKLVVVVENSAHLCLLQHDLRQPYPVRVLGVLPRQVIAAVNLLPRHQGLGQWGRIFQCF